MLQEEKPMSYAQALDFIHAHKRFCGAPTLERMRTLMQMLKNPQNTLKFMHIAGTNGKGSATAMSANVLCHAGYKTGRYVSPFVLCFRERMQVNGEMIPEAELAALAGEVKLCENEMANGGEHCRPTEFEVVTAIAFLWFAKMQCDIVCLEVGLGGQFDATNVIEPPLVQVIMAISLDHTNVLGDTIEQIAFEKCGIIKGGVTVCYPLQEDDALAVIMEQCSNNLSMLIQPNPHAVTQLSKSFFAPHFIYGALELKPALLGEHQIYNAITVVEACRVLTTQGFAITDDDISAGIAGTAFPARLELLCKSPLVLLDGAHNPGGAAALEQALLTLRAEGCGKITVLMGMLEDKDWQHSAERIARCADSFIGITPDNPRALGGEVLAQHASRFCPCSSAGNALTVEATAQKLALLRAAGGALIVCGSLYLAAQLRPTLLEALIQSGAEAPLQNPTK